MVFSMKWARRPRAHPFVRRMRCGYTPVKLIVRAMLYAREHMYAVTALGASLVVLTANAALFATGASIFASASASAAEAEEVRPALRVAGPLSPRNASYRLRARLDEVNHRIIGEGTLTWRNIERQPADRLVFHLYQNAFKNLTSTFVFEAGPQLRGEIMPQNGYGAIDMSKLTLNGRDLLADATLDDTLLIVTLPEPIATEATVELQMAWTVQLPRVFARSGWVDDFYAGTQWFPKIGVFDCADDATKACHWRAHQYHGFTEFFSDYGVYDVEIDAPRTSVIGATGVLTAQQDRGERRVHRYHAEDVHDFAFFADSQFVEVSERIFDEYGSVIVRLLTRPQHQPYTSRHLSAVRAAFFAAERNLGVYPYSSITVVIPPSEGLGAGGMEYPTLFTSMPLPFPSGVHFMENITAHEFVHQYFYGLLGSDEVEEAWLDEGITESFTATVMDELYGERCSAFDLLGLCISSIDEEWLGYRTTTRYMPIASRSFTILQGFYGPIVYSHTAVALHTLQRYLGKERFMAGLRRYFERFRFRHPRQADFVAAMSEGAGEDLTWFLQQALDSTRVADYQIYSLESKAHELGAGLWDCTSRPLAPTVENKARLRPHEDTADPMDPSWLRDRQALIAESQERACSDKGRPRPAGRHELGSEQTSTALYDSTIVVQRRGDFYFPVDILATFADGSTERTKWTLTEQQAGSEVRFKILRYPRRASPLVRADVDPEQTLLLDENRINNSRYIEPRRQPIARLYFSWVGALATLFDLLGA